MRSLPAASPRAIPSYMSGLEMPRITPLAATLVALAAVLAGCASADSSSRRGSARAASDVEPIERHPLRAEVVPEAPEPASGESAPSHRLRHTITLGDGYGDAPRESSRRIGADRGSFDGPGAPPPPSPPPIYVYPPTYGYGYPYGYGGYGYGGYGYYGYPGCCGRDVDRRPATPRPSPERPPALGQDWAPPPQYGPRFPFKTAPADPWK